MIAKEDVRFMRLMPDHPKYYVSNRGDVYNREQSRFLKQEVVEGGYLRVTLDGGKYYVHKLVAEKFIANPEYKRYVIHLDGNKSNNHVDNLAWSNGFKVIS